MLNIYILLITTAPAITAPGWLASPLELLNGVTVPKGIVALTPKVYFCYS